jgi:hypothetical protein
MLRPTIHLILHFIVPGMAARIGYKAKWSQAWFHMMLSMAIDLDHLLADPVFDANRCSIDFHPLHTYPVIGGYMLLTAFPKTRIFGIGLLIHIFLDALDCLWMTLE